MVSRHSSPSSAERMQPTTSSISDQPKPVLMAALPPETWLLDPVGQEIVAQHLRRQAEESRVLKTKVAQLEAQLRRQSAEFARRTPSPKYSPQPDGCHRRTVGRLGLHQANLNFRVRSARHGGLGHAPRCLQHVSGPALDSPAGPLDRPSGPHPGPAESLFGRRIISLSTLKNVSLRCP